MSNNEAYKEIAPRLQGLRDAMDMSIEELAEKTGVTAEKAALYESGTVEIPVSYLMDVAHLCGVSLTVLISGNEAYLKNYALVRKGKGLNVDRRKDYDYKNLAATFVGRRMEPFMVNVPPKEVADMNFTTHRGQEFIYVLEGRLELRLDKSVVELEVGDSLYFDSNTPHALRGLDGKSARMLDVIL
ncbi:helix-turn-helix domain-containing protein [Maridesulfovibrio hydrothermalis]|uniref:Transcriptional regulator, XRE family n=1 Tax=Maridesulfovibrio hydrothermalis AM13 = DSM 14728 TaxID=1121451 RepID=L0R9G1_9BACT|nr:XRE family transcriptional regulator [Maridesulfovibrio hydrothermalis]CCO22852.1 Transcriptional regulator, XRE family [Maridesulfovibrio hydrothermalis AM13 = DSM 14728]